MRPKFNGEAVVLDDAKLSSLREFAENHRIDRDYLIRIKNQEVTPPGRQVCYYADLGAYRVHFTVEEQQLTKGGYIWCRHLSICVNDSNRVPDRTSVESVMQAMGYTVPLSDCYIWTEKGDIEGVPMAIVHVLVEMAGTEHE